MCALTRFVIQCRRGRKSATPWFANFVYNDWQIIDLGGPNSADLMG